LKVRKSFQILSVTSIQITPTLSLPLSYFTSPSSSSLYTHLHLWTLLRLSLSQLCTSTSQLSHSQHQLTHKLHLLQSDLSLFSTQHSQLNQEQNRILDLKISLQMLMERGLAYLRGRREATQDSDHVRVVFSKVGMDLL
jgi:hypothetical protein